MRTVAVDVPVYRHLAERKAIVKLMDKRCVVVRHHDLDAALRHIPHREGKAHMLRGGETALGIADERGIRERRVGRVDKDKICFPWKCAGQGKVLRRKVDATVAQKARDSGNMLLLKGIAGRIGKGCVKFAPLVRAVKAVKTVLVEENEQGAGF